MSNWHRKMLGEISSSTLGKMLDKEKNRGTYHPYLANYNVRWGEFDLTKIQEMKFEDHEHERYGLKYGDLIICEGGEPGRCAIWRDNTSNMKIQKALHRLRMNKGFSYDFLYYRMLLASRTGELSKYFIGSTIKHLTGIKLKQIEFNFPSKSIQYSIASVLRALDEKIEINNRINTELEAMAKILYDYWFVQFDFPDANGKPYRSSGGKMVYNSVLKREIPKGWRNAFLGDFITLERGVTYGKGDVRIENDNDTIGVLRATNVKGNVVDIDDLVFIPSVIAGKSQTLKKFDTLIVMSSGSKEHVGKNGIYYFDNHHAFGAFCSKITASNGFVFFVNTFMQSSWFKSYIRNQCLGTNINNLMNKHISMCEIISPESSVLASFEKKLAIFYEKIALNTQESRQLEKLRDWLLPMLMNGQVTMR